MTLKLTVLALVVLSTQGYGRQFRRLSTDYEQFRFDPVSVRGGEGPFQVRDDSEAIAKPAPQDSHHPKIMEMSSLFGSLSFLPSYLQSVFGQNNGLPTTGDGAQSASSSNGVMSLPNLIVISSKGFRNTAEDVVEQEPNLNTKNSLFKRYTLPSSRRMSALLPSSYN